MRIWMKRPSWKSGKRLVTERSQLLMPGPVHWLPPPIFPKLAMVTLGLPQAPIAGGAAMSVLNHLKKVWVPLAWQDPTMLTRAPSAEPVGSCVEDQPRPGLNGLPLMNEVTPESSHPSSTNLAGLRFISG